MTSIHEGGLRMSDYTIYHNPNCSKSRATLALLEENGVDPTIVYYLDNPLDEDQLRTLLSKLGISVRELIRKSESAYDQLGLDDETLSDALVFDILLEHPQLMQRPIVVHGDRALISRPPERVLELLDQASGTA